MSRQPSVSWPPRPGLLEKWSGPGPRYTSYPTAPVWSDDFGVAEAEAATQRAASRTGEPLAVYVHVPFCERRCLFCGCTVNIQAGRWRASKGDAFLEALEAEAARLEEAFGGRRPATQIHLGGGTPTWLSPDQLRRLMTAVTAAFPPLDHAEISVEVDPRVTTPDHVAALSEMGFRRISLGVQDTDEGVQQAIHRGQTCEQTADLIEAFRDAGVDGVNLDLIYGLPRQGQATWAATLDAVAVWRPDRLAVYGYAHVPWLKPHQRSLEDRDLPDAALRTALFAAACEHLDQGGYQLIGLDHFALPDDALARGLADGSLHRNFMGYTTMHADEMVALGPSAISDVGGAFLQNARETGAWTEAALAGRPATTRGHLRSPDDDVRRAAIGDLMCRMALDLDDLEERFSVTDLGERFAGAWQALCGLEADGLCTVTERRVTVEPAGRLFLRHLAMPFDAYLESTTPDRQGQEQAGRFSQTL